MNRLPIVFLGFSLAMGMQQVFGAPFKTSSLSCASFFSESTTLPKGAKVLGPTSAAKLPLLNAGLVFGKAVDITSPVFNEETLDEWTVRADGSEQTLAEYDQGHQDLMLRCTYKSRTGGSDSTSTTLLVPLPDRPVSCRIVRKAERALSATCTVR